MVNKNGSNGLVKVRKAFIDENAPMTLSVISQKTGLKSSSISMALLHLLKQGYVTRKQTQNLINGRKMVWLYQYHYERIKFPGIDIDAVHGKEINE